MLRRNAADALHGLLRKSVAATEWPASAWITQPTSLRLMTCVYDAVAIARRASARSSHTLQCWEAVSGSVTGAAARSGAANSTSAVPGAHSCAGNSILGRQFTSLREVSLGEVGRLQQGCSEQCVRSSREQALSAQQLRAFAAGSRSSTSTSSRAALGPGSHRTAHKAWAEQKSSSQALYLVAMTVAMVGVTYSSVPLYRMFCQATGYGGTVAEGKTVEDKLRAREENPNEDVEAAAAAREVTVSFNADVNDNMPWKFQPTQRSIKLRPGQSTLAFYTAENTSDRVITGVSTYNVTPQQAGTYFNKIQCFCFEEQKLRPGEKIDMPVFFYVDPEFATDPRMRKVNHLTLSYTFFKVSDQTVEEDAAAVPEHDDLDSAQHAGGVVIPAAAAA